jgi:hypothetical protein
LSMPDESARLQMLTQFLKPMPSSQTLAQLMAYVTDGSSGADLRRFANAIKRSIALSNVEPTAAHQFKALRDVLAREPSTRTHPRAARLIGDLEAFAVEALSDPHFTVKQKPLATLLSVNQGTVSRWVTRAGSVVGNAHAQ